ncbi:MAG: DUF3179 domain-containing protein [Chitinophagales bacterium]
MKRNYIKYLRSVCDKRHLQSYHFLFLIITSGIMIAGCKGQVKSSTAQEEEKTEKKIYDQWLIDYESVESGCERVDCIRSVDDPKFISVSEADFINDEDLVIGIKWDDEIKCYPHAILNWHEIINDKIAGRDIAINYCPLTGSGMAWDRNINGKISEFGVSGMLYNSNIIPYDRNTRSAWSQMKQLCVNGELMDSAAHTYQVIETSWLTWKKLYPESKVLSTETGMQRDYLNYPYSTYRENREIYFSVDNESDTLHPKERLFGIIENDKAKCYRFSNFKGGIRVLNDTAFNKNIIIVGSERDNIITAFENPSENKFSSVTNKIPGIFKDDKNNIYDVFGYCIEGDKKGQRLIPVNGFIAYWFAWYGFYPDLRFE